MPTPHQFNTHGAKYLPGLPGIVITRVRKSEARSALARILRAERGASHRPR